jgi:hyperosmotically inducible protein
MRRVAASSLLPLMIAALAIGCSNRPDRYESSRNETTPPATDQAAAQPSTTDSTYTGNTGQANNNLGTMQGSNPNTNPNADNTAMNQRDRANTVTPMDQAENATDRTITQGVRKAIIADKNLSVTAKNVKIVTAQGVVTLRGPVKTEQERATVAEKAQQVAGVMRVDNQLEVITQ